MDELKMDGLDLPDTGETYDDLPDASEGLEETANDTPRPSDSMDNFDDIAMPVLSEMDGSEVTALDKQAEKAVTPDKPAEPKPMFEDMSAPARPQSTQQSSSSGQSTYQSTSGSYKSTSSSYQSSYQSTSGRTNPRTTSSMDDLYAARMAVDPEKYEKGRKKTKIVAGVGIALYGYNTLSYLLSLIGGGGLTILLDLGISGFLLYLFIRFFIGSNTAKETLAWWISIDVIFNIIGIITAGVATAAFSSIGLGGLFGFLAVMGIISLVARCVMLYFLILDEDISEYSKNKQ
ncbi:hypothetical protein [Huintestinicola sp.]|uniref:hypothetical protein n=1 Tax=Huintestinicola sp. TaxID=2981661 RepID=UPI003D7E1926